MLNMNSINLNQKSTVNITPQNKMTFSQNKVGLNFTGNKDILEIKNKGDAAQESGSQIAVQTSVATVDDAYKIAFFQQKAENPKLDDVKIAQNLSDSEVEEIKKQIEEGDKSYIIARNEEQQIIGMITLLPSDTEKTRVLKYLVIEKNNRGKGIEKELLICAVKLTKKLGDKRLALLDADSQFATVARKLGFSNLWERNSIMPKESDTRALAKRAAARSREKSACLYLDNLNKVKV